METFPQLSLGDEARDLIQHFMSKPMTDVVRQDFSDKFYRLLESHDLTEIRWRVEFNKMNRSITIKGQRKIDDYAILGIFNS